MTNRILGIVHHNIRKEKSGNTDKYTKYKHQGDKDKHYYLICQGAGFRFLSH